MDDTIDGARKRLSEMFYLEHGWDSYDAPAPTASCINRALAFLETYIDSLWGVRVYPDASEGQVVIVMYSPYRNDKLVEVEFDDKNRDELLITIIKNNKEKDLYERGNAWEMAHYLKTVVE